MQRVRPEVKFEKTSSGKHRLSRYGEIMGFDLPTKCDQDVAAKGIRIMRHAIERYGSDAAIPSSQTRERCVEGRPRPQPTRLQGRPSGRDAGREGVWGDQPDLVAPARPLRPARGYRFKNASFFWSSSS